MSIQLSGGSIDAGRYPAASSIPVTLASDSSFNPNTTYSGLISGTTNASGAPLSTSLATIRLTNAGPTNPIFFRFGTTPTATTTDCVILSGQSALFNTGLAASISAVTSTSTAALYYSQGVGGL